MMPQTEPSNLRKLFEVWVDSELKAQIIVFYQNNPGVIDTIEGLASRLGTNVEQLRTNIADHLQLGFLHERKVGSQVVLVYDRKKQQGIQEFIAAEMGKLSREGVQ
ncbi:MAG: hypothetical protein QOD77_244 [Thermoplasmata archaeon]|nr:hypothetical protein [Thermoplasmata archaeon]